MVEHVFNENLNQNFGILEILDLINKLIRFYMYLHDNSVIMRNGRFCKDNVTI
jgi:hypothetical protein